MYLAWPSNIAHSSNTSHTFFYASTFLGLLETYKVIINSEFLLFEDLIASPMDTPFEGVIALSL